MMLRTSLRWLAVAGVFAALATFAVYLSDMRDARKRISGRSTIFPSPFGDIEYTEHGVGLPVLVVHGSGGGFDQGELVADAVLDERFRRITPSRFGYLRSTFRDSATFDDQAHAYAHLLDALAIRKIAVVALSHGGPSALLFAALYPERVSSLTLLSAGVAASASEGQAAANAKGDMLTTIFKFDLLYWVVSRVFRRQLLGLMGVDKAIVFQLTPEQRTLAGEVIDYMNPVTLRSAGVTFDNTAEMPNERIAAVEAPTLVVHAADDALQLYHNAEFAMSTIPNVRLMRFEKGGHLVLIVEQSRIRAATMQHILAH